MHRDDELDTRMDLRDAIWIALDEAHYDGELSHEDIMKVLFGAIEAWNDEAGFQTTKDLYEVWKETLRSEQDMRPLSPKVTE